ncbi:hypothetical protein GGR51DRAFT_533311 [Nemania sp. FL0031]|nr:hypothetical protein GGR51DRAFT_533311 [Nemania sp. FL0031]
MLFADINVRQNQETRSIMPISSLGPLPTSFTLVSSCASELQDLYNVHFSGWVTVLQGPQEQTTCYPNIHASDPGFYSPAFCPIGFTAACKLIDTLAAVEETILGCCPTVASFRCKKSFIWETQGCTSHITESIELLITGVSDGTTSRGSKTILTSGDGLNAYVIQARYRATDFISTTTTSSSFPSSRIASGSRPTSSSASFLTTSALDQPTQTPISAPGSISDREIRIVVGAVGGVVVILLVGLLICQYRRRRHSQSMLQHEKGSQLRGSNNLQVNTEYPPIFQAVSVGPSTPYELSVTRSPVELNSETVLPSPSEQLSNGV